MIGFSICSMIGIGAFAVACAWALREARIWRGAAMSESRALERAREQLLREKRVSKSFQEEAQSEANLKFEMAGLHWRAMNTMQTEHERKVQMLRMEIDDLKKRVQEANAECEKLREAEDARGQLWQLLEDKDTECEKLRTALREAEDAREQVSSIDITTDLRNLLAYKGDGSGQIDPKGREG